MLVLTAWLAPVRASAQPVITAGVKGGVNVATVDYKLTKLTEFTISPKSRPGVIIGGFLGIDKKKAGLAIEGLFSQNGTTLEFTQGGDTDKQEIRIDYIAFPILGRVNLKGSNAVLVHLYLGPVFGFRTGFETKETLTVSGVTTTTTDNDDSDVEGSNIDLAFGGQVDFHEFLVDLRYNLGLTNINKATDTEEPEVKNRTFSIMFGVRFK